MNLDELISLSATGSKKMKFNRTAKSVKKSPEQFKEDLVSLEAITKKVSKKKVSKPKKLKKLKIYFIVYFSTYDHYKWLIYGWASKLTHAKEMLKHLKAGRAAIDGDPERFDAQIVCGEYFADAPGKEVG